MLKVEIASIGKPVHTLRRKKREIIEGVSVSPTKVDQWLRDDIQGAVKASTGVAVLLCLRYH